MAKPPRLRLPALNCARAQTNTSTRHRRPGLDPTNACAYARRRSHRAGTRCSHWRKRCAVVDRVRAAFYRARSRALTCPTPKSHCVGASSHCTRLRGTASGLDDAHKQPTAPASHATRPGVALASARGQSRCQSATRAAPHCPRARSDAGVVPKLNRPRARRRRLRVTLDCTPACARRRLR
jgi:hypothetical protein